MVGVPSRHKSIFLLGGMVLLQILLLAAQIKRDAQGRLIRVWTVGAISPFERAGSYGIGSVRGTWGHYFALQNTSRENEELKHENDVLKLQVTQLQSRVSEAERLEHLLNFREAHQEAPMMGARVIGTSADTATRAVYIDRGERDGVQRNMAVITPNGIVGKVIETFSNTAQVLLITDKEGGAGAMLAESRNQGVVGGTGEPLLEMKYIANDDKVDVGEQVVTSGMDRIFPPDLPVGTVAEVKAGNPFKVIRLRPAAKLEQLEEVIILTTLHPLEVKKESAASDPATAGAKASNATSAPGKPATDKNATAQPAVEKPKPPAANR
ncbi:MAG TPA: rod shape-determining protein MreC [Candidatus Acidoferrum sp.]|nr:rod shape-determining protein MreC [Candidatus Acidoferrum sp.]